MGRWITLRFGMSLLGILVLVLGGCSIAGKSPPTRFYMLTPESDTGAEIQLSAESRYTVVRVDPVEFPDYLNRSQLVVRQSGNRYTLAEFDRWAESLQGNFERVLVKNLNGMVQDTPFAVVQWRRYLDIDYVLRVMVTCLEGDTEGNVTLGVTWMLVKEDGERPVTVRMSTYTDQSTPGDYGEMAAAQSRLLEAFSRDVAAAIQRLTG